jgi:ribonuclease-3
VILAADILDEITLHEKRVREFLARPPFNKRGLSDKEISFFCNAFTHDSYTAEALNLVIPRNVPDNERLEFLGDAVIELITCEHIFLNTELKEGEMTDFKKGIVANKKISARLVEKKFDIDSMLLVGCGHRNAKTKENIVGENMRADAFEALIGATFIVFGLDEARRIAKELLIL